ncbi:hypothetical protein SAMN02910449_1370, partial [Streptococcus equinus]|uniref:hypothetical protein n=1 Tax=Streptococcus equinus TaxID=1335 RepID=UPI00087177B5
GSDLASAIKTGDDYKIGGYLFDVATFVGPAAVGKLKYVDEASALTKLTETSEVASTVGKVEDGVRVVDKVSNIPKELKIIKGKVDGKIPISEYNTYRKMSIINPESDTMTLGKYRPTVYPDGSLDWSVPGPDSYTVMAGDTTFFSLGGEWDKIISNYHLDTEGHDMFRYFNQPALDDAVAAGKEIRFSHDPRLKQYEGSALDWEWNYLKDKYNYIDLDEIGGYWYASK